MADESVDPTPEAVGIGQPAPAMAPAAKRDYIPQKLTPKMVKAIRLVASGMSRQEAAREVGLRGDYVEKTLRAPIGRAEFDRIKTILEKATVDKMASVEAGMGTPGMTEAAAEVELAVLEAIQKLRKIMNHSRSDMAVANAAKQILELAQAAKRMAASQAPQDEGVPLTTEDQTFLFAAIGDLRTMNALGAPGASDNTDDDSRDDTADAADPAPVADTAPTPWTEASANEVVEGGLPASTDPSKV